MFNLRYKWKKLTEEQSYKLKVQKVYKPIAIRLDDHRICVVRLEDGWFGVNNICPHAGAALHPGFCNKRGILACPLHGYKFDVRTGKSIDGNNYYQKTFKVEKRDDGFYIGIKKF